MDRKREKAGKYPAPSCKERVCNAICMCVSQLCVTNRRRFECCGLNCSLQEGRKVETIRSEIRRREVREVGKPHNFLPLSSTRNVMLEAIW